MGGFTPLAAGQSQSSYINQVLGFGGPDAGGVSAGAQGLLDQSTANDLTSLNVYSATQNAQFASTMRAQIAAAVHTMANQAESFAQQFIGDQISQEKKSNENSGKAV